MFSTVLQLTTVSLAGMDFKISFVTVNVCLPSQLHLWVTVTCLIVCISTGGPIWSGSMQEHIQNCRTVLRTLGGAVYGGIHSAARLFLLWSFRDFFCYWYRLDRICVHHSNPLNPDQPLILIKLLGDTLQHLVAYNRCICRLPFSLEPLDLKIKWQPFLFSVHYV